MGSIFDKGKTIVSLKTEENNTLDTVVEGLDGIKEELALTRKGHEAMSWGEKVEDNEDVDMEDENG